MGKRHSWPDGESGSLQSSRRGFDSWDLVLLGPLHVELSSGHRENHPPLQQPAPPPIPADRVEVSSVLRARQKCTRFASATNMHTQAPRTPAAACSAACTQTDRREGPSGIQRHRWGGEAPSDPALPAGFEPPSSGRAPGALPLRQRPPWYVWPLFRGATARGACAHTVIPAICASFSFFIHPPWSALFDSNSGWAQPFFSAQQTSSRPRCFCLRFAAEPSACCAYTPPIVCILAVWGNAKLTGR